MLTRIRSFRLVVLAAVLLGGLSTAALRAGEAKSKAYRGVLPEDVLVHVRTAPLQTTIKNVESFLLASVAGLPAPIQPGMLRHQFTMALGLPPEVIEMDRPAEFLLWNPGPGAPEPPMAFLLPCSSFKEKKEKIGKAGFKLEEAEPGVYTIHSPMAPKSPFFLAPAEDGNVALAKTAANALRGAALSPKMKRGEPKDDAPGATLTVTVDMGKVMVLNEGAIDRAMQMATGLLHMQAAKKDAPPFLPKLMALLPSYLDDFRDVLESMKSVRKYVYFDKKRLLVSTFVTPQPETSFDTLVRAYEASDPSYAQVKYLPASPAGVVCGQVEKKGTEALRDWAGDILEEMGAVFGAEEIDDFLKSHRAFLDEAAGEYCGAILEQESGSPAALYLARVPEPKKFRDNYLELLAGSEELMDAVLGLAAEAGPAGQTGLTAMLDVKVEIEPKAGTVEGVDYASARFLPGEKLSKSPAAAQMRQVFEMLRYWIAITEDGTVVLLSNTRSPKAMEEAIRALQADRPRLAATNVHRAALEAMETKQVAFYSLFLLNLMRSSMENAFTNVPAPPGMAKAFKSLPDSKHPLVFSIGTKMGSLRTVLHLSTDAINESALAFFQLGMKMQQAQKSQAAPPAQDVKKGDSF